MIAEIEAGLQPVRPGKEFLTEQWMHDRDRSYSPRPTVYTLRPCEVLQCPKQPEGNDATGPQRHRRSREGTKPELPSDTSVNSRHPYLLHRSQETSSFPRGY